MKDIRHPSAWRYFPDRSAVPIWRSRGYYIPERVEMRSKAPEIIHARITEIMSDSCCS